jgi:hypothetical protein
VIWILNKRNRLIGILLIIHGLILIMFEFYITDPSGPGVGWSGHSWLLTSLLGNPVILIFGRLLWTVAIISFVAAGVAVLLKKKMWRWLDVLAAAVSLLAFILFWDGLMPEPIYWIVGPIVAVITLVALLLVRWPPDKFIFGS